MWQGLHPRRLRALHGLCPLSAPLSASWHATSTGTHPSPVSLALAPSPSTPAGSAGLPHAESWGSSSATTLPAHASCRLPRVSPWSSPADLSSPQATVLLPEAQSLPSSSQSPVAPPQDPLVTADSMAITKSFSPQPCISTCSLAVILVHGCDMALGWCPALDPCGVTCRRGLLPGCLLDPQLSSPQVLGLSVPGLGEEGQKAPGQVPISCLGVGQP